jgi:uncharacterized protein involved in exopolysaccharide biosynthesis
MNESTQKADMAEIVRILRRRFWWVLAGVVLGAAAGVAVATTATPMYRAEVVLVPIKRTGSGAGLQAFASQLGGIASLAGLDVGGGDDAGVAVATLKSHRVTAAYIEEKNLLPALYPGKWDAERGQWKTKDPKKIPTAWSADRMFGSKIRGVTENRTTGLVTMTIEWKDPNVAAQWAHDLVARTNDLLRSEAYDNARRNIDFIGKQLQATSIVEVRQTLNRLLEEQWNKLMLAQGETEYALRTIDPAVPPARPSNLPKSVVVLIWVLLGMFGACVIAVADRFVWVREVPPP